VTLGKAGSANLVNATPESVTGSNCLLPLGVGVGEKEAADVAVDDDIELDVNSGRERVWGRDCTRTRHKIRGEGLILSPSLGSYSFWTHRIT
jgi:hypothetical protein